MSVKRFSAESYVGTEYNGDSYSVAEMVECNEGDYVHYEDYQQLVAQNAELMAQVDAITDAAIQICMRSDGDGVSIIGLEDDIENLQQVINQTPTQHLRDRDAEVGRAGYMECAKDNGLIYPESSAVWTNKEADEYAEKVRSGL